MAHITRRGAVFALLAFALVGPALAEDVTRSGPRGTVTKSYDTGSGVTVERSGTNGGSSSSTRTCSRGSGVTCQRDYALTGPDGQTVSGTQESRYGLRRGIRTNTVTGPDGESLTRYRPTVRYNRRTPAAPAPRIRRALRW